MQQDITQNCFCRKPGLFSLCLPPCLIGNARGILNIVALAVTLPVLLLLTVAAVDIIRLPIVKQQMESTLEAGYDALIVSQDKNNRGLELAAGKNWCALNPDSPDCPPCDKNSHTCTGARDSQGAKKALHRASEQIFQELTKSGFGLLSHKEKDVTLELAIYNLIVDENGFVVGKELVSNVTGVKAQSLESNNFLDAPKQDLNKLVDSTFLEGKKLRIGIPLTIIHDRDSRQTDGGESHQRITYTDVPIVVMSAHVRAGHIFRFTETLGLGNEPSTKAFEDKPKAASLLHSSLLTATLIRPLTRGIRLSE